ncbi:MAG: Gldg family protein, partial [Planctomycetota bacterium]
MAVERNQPAKGSSAGGGRRFLVGSNVAMTIALVIAIAGVLQYFAYRYPAKADMTSTGVNSLSDGTMNLLRGLETPVKLTSFYFETDLEDEDQPRYRRTVEDLLGLYSSTNRGKITTEWVNPLSDHDKVKKLVAELRDKPTFKEELSAHRARLDRYQSELNDRMSKLVSDELSQLASLGAGMQDQGIQRAIGPVED